jgi:hypothetical protein
MATALGTALGKGAPMKFEAGRGGDGWECVGEGDGDGFGEGSGLGEGWGDGDGFGDGEGFGDGCGHGDGDARGEGFGGYSEDCYDGHFGGHYGDGRYCGGRFCGGRFCGRYCDGGPQGGGKKE